MADLQDLAKILPSMWELTIGADNAPLMTKLALPEMIKTELIKSIRYGMDAIDETVMSRTFQFELEIQQVTDAEIIKFGWTATSAPRDAPAIGSISPKTTLTFHNPAAATAAGDLFFHRASLKLGPIESAGEGVQKAKLIGQTFVDLTTRKVWRVGAAS